MSEAQDVVLGYPCDFCHAQPGEPCSEDCPGFEGGAWPEGLNGTPPVEESEAKLMAAVHRLPYGGLVGMRGMGAPDRQDYPREKWMSMLADWMVEYQETLAAEVAKLEADSVRLISLQMERDMVRNYLKGTPL